MSHNIALCVPVQVSIENFFRTLRASPFAKSRVMLTQNTRWTFQVGLGLAKLFFLSEHEGLGLFLVSCVPGGGAGHLLVSIIGADRSLSISINCANLFLAVGEFCSSGVNKYA